MTDRTRFLITALFVCHLLVAPGVVTSQSQPERAPAPEAQITSQKQESSQKSQPRLVGPNEPGEEVTIEAREQEKIGDVYHLRGDAVVTFRRFTLRADEMTYNDVTGDLSGSGHLVFDGGPRDEHIEADHATYNTRTDTGKFYEVRGTIGARYRGTHVLLTSSNPFIFSGSLVEKEGPTHFVVHHGTVTSCELPHPKWTFDAAKVTIEVGEEARMYHSTFRLMGIPVFYFPFAQHPVDQLGRQSGFLIPAIGQSSVKGTILGEGVYLAINRSMDATAAAEYYSERGWAQQGQFRWRPSDDSYLEARYVGVLDRGRGSPPVDQGGEDIHFNAEKNFSHGFRGVADLEYLNSFVFRLAFAETFTVAVDSEVRSNAFLSKAYKGFFFNGAASRYQNFESTTRGDVITILHAPSLDLSSVDQRLGPTPIVWSYSASATGVSRREPDFVVSNLVGRFDLEPRIALPIVAGGWSIRPEVGLRDTYYTQSRLPVTGTLTSSTSPGRPLFDAVNRRALETSVEIRPPALSRIFERKVAGHTLKHTIEPRLTYRYVNGVDNFPAIIRFDQTDILSDTNELEYAVVNRLYAKGSKFTECATQTAPETGQPAQGIPGTPGVQRRPLPTLVTTPAPECQPGPPQAREFISWEVGQKYFFDPTFGHALVPGVRNVFTTTAEFSGIAFLTDPRRFAPVISRLRVETTRRTDLQWNLDYDTKKGEINASTVLVEHRFGDFFTGASHAFVRDLGEAFVSAPTPIPTVFNQVRWLVGYGSPSKRGINAAANVGFDINSGFVQYSAFQTSYNWNCCGLNFEYRRFALGSVRNENQFRFALSLSNVGTFGTLRRQERLF